MCENNKNQKLSYIEKTGSAMRISQKISALEKSTASRKEIVVPKSDRHIAQQIINNKDLSESIKIKSI